ncbi:MAG: DUF2628 domain-containing protein [Acidibrevibacterium sp.]|uniref:DUF2628 domain-containing protein n=1 Tax=Acidibrevibacterium sp. TaxID=2606776 RepID=UPI003D088D93
MRFYTAHLAQNQAPVLVREGFSLGAMVFGPLWLAFHRAWIAAALVVAAEIVVTAAIARLPALWPLALALHWLLGLFGQDLRRIALAWRGYGESAVIAATGEFEACARLLAARPELAPAFLAGSGRR